MVFSRWAGIVRVVIVGTLAYVALVLLLRVSGKRTLSTMNAFDLVVTVALGSTLATVILIARRGPGRGGDGLYPPRRPPIRHHLALGPLLARQPPGQGGADVAPLPGTVLVAAAVRQQGIAALSGVEAVVLETDGSMTVVARSEGPATALGALAPEEPPAVPGERDR